MKKIITAINNPKLNEQLNQLNQYKIVAPDIQYQDGIFEILEKEKEIQFLILSEILYGKNNLKELIQKIKKINSKIKIILILEKENTEKEKFLKEENINEIFYHNQFTIKDIISILEKENNNTKNIEEEIEIIKKLILQNKVEQKEKMKVVKQQIDKIKKLFKKKKQEKTLLKNHTIITVAGTSGSGKSIISSLLSVNIKQKLGRVLLIDFDILNNDIHTIFGKSILPKRKNKKIKMEQKEINLRNIKIKINKNLDLICATKLLFENEKINLNQLNNILEKLKKEYAIIIIDTSSECFFDYQKLLLEKSNQIVFLTDINLLEIKKSINLLKIYLQEWQIEIKKFSIIFNKYGKESIDENILKNIFKEFYILGKLKLNIKYNQIINQNMKKIILNKKTKKEYQNLIEKMFQKENKKIKKIKGGFYGRKYFAIRE